MPSNHLPNIAMGLQYLCKRLWVCKSDAIHHGVERIGVVMQDDDDGSGMLIQPRL